MPINNNVGPEATEVFRAISNQMRAAHAKAREDANEAYNRYADAQKAFGDEDEVTISLWNASKRADGESMGALRAFQLVESLYYGWEND